jgi:hypothetical protein
MSKSTTGGGRKIGRNKQKCQRYRDMHTRERNKARIAKKIAKEAAKKRAKLVRRKADMTAK